MNGVSADNLGGRARRGIYWNVTLKLLHQGFNVMVVVFLARLLSPADFGVMALAMATIVFANQWTSCGLTSLIVQRGHLSTEEIDTIFTLNLSLSLGMMVLVSAMAWLLASIFDAPPLALMIPVLTVMFPLTAYYYIRTALLRRDVSFRLHSLIELTLGMAQSSATLALASLGVGVWSLVLGHVIGMVIAILTIGIIAPWRPRLRWRFACLVPMMGYGGFDMLRSQAAYLEEYLSCWIVGYAMTPTLLGFFDRANAFARMPANSINLQVNAVFFPAFCRARVDAARLESAFRKGLTAQAMLMSPVFVGLALVSEFVVPLVIGSKWEPMVLPLQILCLAALIRSLSTTLQSLNIATHVYGRQAVAQVAALPVYAVLCVLSLPWGIVGVSLATLAFTCLVFAIFAAITLRVLNTGVAILVDCLGPSLLGVLIMGLIVSALGHTVLADITVVNLLLLMGAGAAVYIPWTLWIPHDETRSVRDDVSEDVANVLRSLGVIGRKTSM